MLPLEMSDENESSTGIANSTRVGSSERTRVIEVTCPLSEAPAIVRSSDFQRSEPLDAPTVTSALTISAPSSMMTPLAVTERSSHRQLLIAEQPERNKRHGRTTTMCTLNSQPLDSGVPYSRLGAPSANPAQVCGGWTPLRSSFAWRPPPRSKNGFDRRRCLVIRRQVGAGFEQQLRHARVVAAPVAVQRSVKAPAERRAAVVRVLDLEERARIRATQ